MSWLFSQALVEEYSAGTSLAGEPCAQLNVMPTPHKFWRLDKMIEHSRLSRFGLTSQLLTEADGEELLMSYLAGSRVKTSALQELGPDSTAGEVDFGAKCGASLARYSQISSTWKTAQCSLLGGSDEFLETWPKWGSMRSGVAYLRPMPALRTYESESGYLPTPVARDYRAPGRSRFDRTGGKQGECLPQVVGGRLKPEFVEWMMGWPIGWTALKPLETARFREWQQQHGGF